MHWCEAELNGRLSGPLYDPRTNIFHFVDILKNRVYNYHLESKELSIHEYEEPVSALAIRADGPGVGVF